MGDYNIEIFKEKALKNYILLFLATLIFTFPILPTAIQSISILSFIGVSIIFFLIKNKIGFTKKQYVGFAITTFWVIYLCFTIFYSDDKSYGFQMAQRYINIVAIPLVFMFFLPNYFFQKRHCFYLAFIGANLLYVFIIYYKAISVVEVSCFPEIYYKIFFEKLKFILKKPNFVIFSCFESHGENSLFIHRVYNSMNFLFSILLLIELLFSKKFNRSIWFNLFAVICFIIFGYLIFYQFSVVNVVLAILLIPTFILIKIPSIRLKKIFVILILFLFSISAILHSNLESNKIFVKYMVPALNLAKKVVTGNDYGNTDERYEINNASWQLIKKAPVFGYGIGDVQYELNNYYNKHSSDKTAYKMAYEENLNSHNNYAYLWLSGGFILLLLYIINLIFGLYYGLLFKEWIYIAFIIIVSANLLFENVLSRIHGVLFYSVFNALFIASLIRKEKTN